MSSAIFYGHQRQCSAQEQVGTDSFLLIAWLRIKTCVCLCACVFFLSKIKFKWMGDIVCVEHVFTPTPTNGCCMSSALLHTMNHRLLHAATTITPTTPSTTLLWFSVLSIDLLIFNTFRIWKQIGPNVFNHHRFYSSSRPQTPLTKQAIRTLSQFIAVQFRLRQPLVVWSSRYQLGQPIQLQPTWGFRL